MVDPFGPWKLEEFPERSQCWKGDLPDEVLDAVEVWRRSREVSPRRGATRLSPDDDRWVAEIPGAHCVDARGRGLRMMCDYRILEEEHKVIWVEYGFLPASDLPG